MTERILDSNAMIAERPIAYSELTAALFDLEFAGDVVAVENARAAYMRGLLGAPRRSNMDGARGL